MTMFNLIKQEQLQARKARDVVKASILTTILGEFARSATKDDPTDAQVFSVLSKLENSVKETYAGTPTDTLRIELGVIAALLTHKPAVATPEEIEALVVQFVAGNQDASIKTLMPYLKQTLGDKFDGQTAKAIATQVLSR